MTSDPSELGVGRGRMRRGGVIVGYEGGPTGHDALAFSTQWAQASGDPMMVVTVHPGTAPISPGHVDAEWVAYEREEADKLLDEARELVPTGVAAEFQRVDASSAAHGLSDLVESDDDDRALLVLGSRRNRGMRRTFPGTTADRLLQGSAVPVAVVPWGYAGQGERRLARVAVAYVESADGREAFEQAVRIARHLGATLTVVSVVPDTRIMPSMGEVDQFLADEHAAFRAELERVVAEAPDDVNAEGRLLPGPVVDALAELSPDDYDLLVVGSRGYGPVRRVLLGGVSSRVVRHSRLPVVVVPRGD